MLAQMQLSSRVLNGTHAQKIIVWMLRQRFGPSDIKILPSRSSCLYIGRVGDLNQLEFELDTADFLGGKKITWANI